MADDVTETIGPSIFNFDSLGSDTGGSAYSNIAVPDL